MKDSISIRRQYCPNPSCPVYQKQAQGNIVIHSQKHKRLKCSRCKTSWGIRRGTLMYGLHSDPKKVELALERIKQGISLRKIAQILNISPSTVHRWKKRMLKSKQK